MCQVFFPRGSGCAHAACASLSESLGCAWEFPRFGRHRCHLKWWNDASPWHSWTMAPFASLGTSDDARFRGPRRSRDRNLPTFKAFGSFVAVANVCERFGSQLNPWKDVKLSLVNKAPRGVLWLFHVRRCATRQNLVVFVVVLGGRRHSFSLGRHLDKSISSLR